MASGTLKIKAKVEGKQKVKGYLAKAKRCLEDANFNKSLEAGAKVFEKGMKGRAPVDTGRLKRSIKIREASGRGRGRSIAPGIFIWNPYAVQQEKGAEGHPYMHFKYKGQWVKKRKIKFTPYVEPTWRGDKDAAYQAFKKQLFNNWPE